MKIRFIALLLIISLLSVTFGMSGIMAASALPFTDVSENDWFYDPILSAYNNNLLKGKSDTIFDPQNNMTRAELVTIMARISEENVEGMAPYAQHFTDVAQNAWYSDYIGWAASNELVKGYNGNSNFMPDSSLIRQELAALIIRLIDYVGVILPTSPRIDAFADQENIPTWAAEDIERLRLTGLIEGDQNKMFNPRKAVTRAEVAAIISRLHNHW